MGCFSWMFADTDNKENLKYGHEFYVPQPNGLPTLHDTFYDCYGHCDGADIYDLVASWNREYLAKHPEHILPASGQKVSDRRWYKYYADYENYSESDVCMKVTQEIRQNPGYEDYYGFDWREIGIAIACEDKNNAALPYPIKVCKHNVPYESVGLSLGDDAQGC